MLHLIHSKTHLLTISGSCTILRPYFLGEDETKVEKLDKEKHKMNKIDNTQPLSSEKSKYFSPGNG